MKDLIMAKKIALEVSKAGGNTYFVGGYVRDNLLGIENKDIDIEIHNINPKKLREVLSNLGTVTDMGASFGILGLNGYDIDIAQPRSEIATGRGHKDFEVFVDPFIGTDKAALRRDFTINGLMQDVLTGEIVDHFNGLSDLKNGLIRHINTSTFVEDPLRVLRAAQFAARFKFKIANETIQLARTMDLSSLAKERVFGELEKGLLKSNKPSIFFNTLREMSQLNIWFKEVEDLIGVEQCPIHHPEGDVWNHTMMVLDYASTIKLEASNPLYFMLAALTHDFGKTITTTNENGQIKSLSHETIGLPLVNNFLTKINNETKLKEYVLNMVELHMYPNAQARLKVKAKTTRHLFDKSINPNDLILLAKADNFGRDTDNDYTKIEEFLRDRVLDYKNIIELPSVTGKDLIYLGYKPGPLFKELLNYSHKLHLAGISKEKAINQVIGYARTLS